MFVTDLGLADFGLKLSDVMYSFMWSRIRSVSDYSDRSQIRLRHLQFEDFLESLVRMSTMLALPHDADPEAATVRLAARSGPRSPPHAGGIRVPPLGGRGAAAPAPPAGHDPGVPTDGRARRRWSRVCCSAASRRLGSFVSYM